MEATRVDYLWIHSSESTRDGWTACELHASASGVFTARGATSLAHPHCKAGHCQRSIKGRLRPQVYVCVCVSKCAFVCEGVCSHAHWSWSYSGRLRPHCSQSHSTNTTCSGLQSEQHRPSIPADTRWWKATHEYKHRIP